MHLTPEMLEAAYAYLATTLPFRRWKLPPAEAVEFRVTRSRGDYGQCITIKSGGTFNCVVEISSVKNKTGFDMIRTMGHEMVHVCLDLLVVRAHHGAECKRRAAIVRRRHSWDPKAF